MSSAHSHIIGVIPARWGSSRFPGKPLHLIAGKAMVLHVWDRCKACKLLDNLIIATDDSRIYEECLKHGANVMMTNASHTTGTDRIAEVASHFPEASHFINIQGDEPLIESSLVDQLAEELANEVTLEMVTAATEITDIEAINDPNVVKVVMNKKRNALYFSRSPIPFPRNQGQHIKFHRHLGIYGYQAGFLSDYISIGDSYIEDSEDLEQLRALDYGANIRIVITADNAIGVDTPEQAIHVEQMILSKT